MMYDIRGRSPTQDLYERAQYGDNPICLLQGFTPVAKILFLSCILYYDDDTAL